MLEWATPAWFAALPLALLPWIAWWRPHALRFSAVTTLRPAWSARRIAGFLPPLLASVAIVLFALALARPQKVMRETEVESDGIDILLAIDTSGSMQAPDMGNNLRELTRLDAARLAMSKFASERPHDRVGLLVFGEEAFVQVPLTIDHDGLVDFIGQLEIGMAGKSATAVGDAIAVACKRMKELDAPSKVVILVTDGRSNAGMVSPALAADAAAALGIKVYTIGVGSDAIDETGLRRVAATTGAKYFGARDINALAGVYADIDALEKSTAKVKEFVHRDELYLRFLNPGLAALALDILLGVSLLRRLP